jgi:hypothetical protein
LHPRFANKNTKNDALAAVQYIAKQYLKEKGLNHVLLAFSLTSCPEKKMYTTKVSV